MTMDRSSSVLLISVVNLWCQLLGSQDSLHSTGTQNLRLPSGSITHAASGDPLYGINQPSIGGCKIEWGCGGGDVTHLQ